jgi:hypothetical protein
MKLNDGELMLLERPVSEYDPATRIATYREGDKMRQTVCNRGMHAGFTVYLARSNDGFEREATDRELSTELARWATVGLHMSIFLIQLVMIPAGVLLLWLAKADILPVWLCIAAGLLFIPVAWRIFKVFLGRMLPRRCANLHWLLRNEGVIIKPGG